MRNLQSLLSGRVSSIRKRVIKPKPRTRRTATGGAKPTPPHPSPGSDDLAAKLARAREQVRRARHGRRAG